MHDVVDAVAALAEQLPERRAELHRDRLLELIGSAHGDTQRGADAAARAVGAHG
jgi:hypothetical protein